MSFQSSVLFHPQTTHPVVCAAQQTATTNSSSSEEHSKQVYLLSICTEFILVASSSILVSICRSSLMFCLIFLEIDVDGTQIT